MRRQNERGFHRRNSYHCMGCGTRINALSVNRTIIEHIMGDVVTAELAAQLQEPVQCQMTEEVRHNMPGIKPPDMSTERVHRYDLDPETYLKGDAEDTAKLMAILVKRIDADGRKAVITFRMSDPKAAEHSAQTVGLHPSAEWVSTSHTASSDAHRAPHR